MTDREKVVKLATEVMGWKVRPAHESRRLVIDCGDGRIRHLTQVNGLVDVWDPLDSILAAYEMESKIPVALRDEYCRALWGLFADIKTPWRSKFEGYWFFTHATARQRCDAAISALEAQCRK